MLGFIIQRVLQAMLVMAAMSALVFIGVYAVGNPIDVLISPDATQDIRTATIARYGLDRPLYEQYFTFLGNILSGDMGRSFVFGMPVLQLILQRLPATLLAFFNLAMMIRLSRAGTRETMLTDTIKFARAAGLSEWTMLRRHVLKLISIPIVTVFGLEFGSTLAFAVVTETIFSWPGVGKLIIDSIAQLDRPVMVAYLMLVALVFIMINLTVDIAYVALDPRLRARRTE